MTDVPIRLSIVLPCYNEAETLPVLLDRYRAIWEDIGAELILVDNGSTDDTPRVLERELRRPEFQFARSVRIEKNIGYGHGIHTGLTSARGEFVAFSHADMQCSPADVFAAFRMLAAAPRPEDVIVKGRRTPESSNSRLVTNVMAALATAVLWVKLTDINAQPKVFHRTHLARLSNPPAGFQYDLYVLYMARKRGLTILSVPVHFGVRTHGHSKWAATLRSRYRTILSTIIYIFRLRLAPI
jgi:glycosyltransferase involved in cell wall biosynthesis